MTTNPLVRDNVLLVGIKLFLCRKNCRPMIDVQCSGHPPQTREEQIQNVSVFFFNFSVLS